MVDANLVEDPRWFERFCPVCGALTETPHIGDCPLGLIEKRLDALKQSTAKLNERIDEVTSLVTRVSRMVRTLDDRTIGMARTGGGNG